MKKTMILAAMLMTAVLALAGCGSKVTLSADASDEKNIVITASKAAKDDFVGTGTLEVAEGEKVTVDSELEKGTIRIELIGTPEEQSIEELPEMDGEAAYSVDASGTETQTVIEAAPGTYMLKITVVEKATGTVNLISE